MPLRVSSSAASASASGAAFCTWAPAENVPSSEVRTGPSSRVSRSPSHLLLSPPPCAQGFVTATLFNPGRSVSELLGLLHTQWVGRPPPVHPPPRLGHTLTYTCVFSALPGKEHFVKCAEVDILKVTSWFLRSVS